MAGNPHGAVKRELLVRYLDAWTPATLHGSRRATFAAGFARTDTDTAVAALRVFGEFTDLLAKHRLTMVLIGSDAEDLPLSGTPNGLEVHAVNGSCDEELVPALTAAQAFGGAILAYLDLSGADPPGTATIAAVSAGKASEVLLALDPSADGYREAVRGAGLAHVADVELVDESGAAQLVMFATASAKNMDRFKDALWAVDEYAGVSYRDPRDPDRELLPISVSPHLGPLRRALLDRIGQLGQATAADLREYTLTETMYRAADATRVLTALLGTGAVTRDPAKGRLAPETVIRRARR
jgi:hypothetical protein